MGEKKQELSLSMERIKISIGNAIYAGEFYDNEVSVNLMKQFPLTLHMENDEKEYFCPMTEKIEGNARATSAIVAGDITVCNSISISIFTSQPVGSTSYVKIGHISNPSGLEESIVKNGGLVTLDFLEESMIAIA